MTSMLDPCFEIDAELDGPRRQATVQQEDLQGGLCYERRRGYTIQQNTTKQSRAGLYGEEDSTKNLRGGDDAYKQQQMSGISSPAYRENIKMRPSTTSILKDVEIRIME